MRQHTARKPRRLHVGVTTAVALVLAAPLTGCSGQVAPGGDGNTRSQAAFCEELSAGNDRMRENYQGATDDAGGQLGAVFANMGEFTTLLHRLDKVAPSEIEVEVHDSREAWDAQAEAAGDVAENPLSGLAAGLMAAMMSNASMKAVDRYAQDHCGLQVFGSVVDTSAAEQAATTWTCDDVSPFGGLNPLDADATLTDLTDTLDRMAASEQPDVAGASIALRTQIDMLDPAPQTSVEAIGRVQYASTDISAGVALFEAVAAACPHQANTTEAEEAAAIGPALANDGTLLRNPAMLYGACSGTGDILGFPDENTMVAFCDDTDSIAVLDVGTGDISWVHADVGQSFLDNLGEVAVALSGRTLAWAYVTDHEASGLNPRTWDATLTLYDLDTAQTTEVPLVTGGKDNSPGRDEIAPAADDFGFSVALWGEGIPGANPDQYQLRHFSRSGNLTWQRDDVGGSAVASIEPVTRHTAFVGVDATELVDVRDGSSLGRWVGGAYIHSVDGCRQHVAVTPRSGKLAWVRDTVDGVSVSPLSPRYPSNGDDGITTPAGGIAFETGARAITPAGELAWRLPGNVVSDVWAVGNWVVVTNTSEELVLVDPVTGTEALDVDAALRETILGAEGWSQIWITDDGQTAWLPIQEGDVAKVPAADLCGSDSGSVS